LSVNSYGRGRRVGWFIPLDGKSGHARLLSENVATNLLNHRLGGGVVHQLLAIVFIVHIVTNADELAAIVGAGEKHDCHAKKLVNGDALGVRRVGLEDELIDANRDRTDEE